MHQGKMKNTDFPTMSPKAAKPQPGFVLVLVIVIDLAIVIEESSTATSTITMTSTSTSTKQDGRMLRAETRSHGEA